MIKVIWIDDDRLFIKPLIDDVKDGGISVKYVHRVDDAIAELELNGDSYKKIFIDVMMQVRPGFDVEEADGGLRTGLVLFSKIKTELPSLANRVSFVTVVNEPDVLAKANEENLRVFPKQSTSSDELIDFIKGSGDG